MYDENIVAFCFLFIKTCLYLSVLCNFFLGNFKDFLSRTAALQTHMACFNMFVVSQNDDCVAQGLKFGELVALRKRVRYVCQGQSVRLYSIFVILRLGISR